MGIDNGADAQEVAQILFSKSKAVAGKTASLSVSALQAIWNHLRGKDTRTNYFPPGKMSLDELSKQSNGQEQSISGIPLDQKNYIKDVLSKSGLAFAIEEHKEDNDFSLFFAPKQRAAIIHSIEKEIGTYKTSTDKVISEKNAAKLENLKNLLIDIKGLPAGKVALADLARSEKGEQKSFKLTNISGQDRAELNELFKGLNVSWSCLKDEKTNEYTLFFKKNQGESVEYALKKVMSKYAGSEEKKRSTEEEFSKGMNEVKGYKEQVDQAKEREKKEKVREKNKGKDNIGGR